MIKDFEKNSLPLWLASLVAGLPCGSAGKESACNEGDLGLIPGLGRSPGGGNSYPLQNPGLENSMDYSPWGHKQSDMTDLLSLSESKAHFLSENVHLFLKMSRTSHIAQEITHSVFLV